MAKLGLHCRVISTGVRDHYSSLKGKGLLIAVQVVGQNNGKGITASTVI